FFFNAPSTTDIYTLSLHDALPIYPETEELHRGEAVHVEAPYLGSPCVLDAVANEEGESDRHQEKLEQSSAPFAHRPPHDSLEQDAEQRRHDHREEDADDEWPSPGDVGELCHDRAKRTEVAVRE